MQEKFVRETKIFELQEKEKKEELLKCVNETRNNLQTMYHNMQFAESDLIDYYTYQIKAEEAKYNYLIKKIKKAQNSEKNILKK